MYRQLIRSLTRSSVTPDSAAAQNWSKQKKNEKVPLTEHVLIFPKMKVLNFFNFEDEVLYVEMVENAVAIYYTTKHSWRGKYKRLFAITEDGVATFNPQNPTDITNKVHAYVLGSIYYI